MMKIALAQIKNEGTIKKNLEKSISLWIQAFQNSVAIAMCNRVGVEDEMIFSGESIVVDANGNVIAKADDKEQLLYVNIDLDQSNKIRNEKPYTNLRRVEFYK